MGDWWDISKWFITLSGLTLLIPLVAGEITFLVIKWDEQPTKD